MYMRCIQLKKVGEAEEVNARIREAVKEMRDMYIYTTLFTASIYEALCIDDKRAELIIYIDLRKTIRGCIEDCLESRKKTHESCIRYYGREACWEYDEEAEKAMCTDRCEAHYLDKADLAVYKILRSLEVMNKYGIKYVEKVSYPSKYEILVKLYLHLK
jgi:hypothetical protein